MSEWRWGFDDQIYFNATLPGAVTSTDSTMRDMDGMTGKGDQKSERNKIGTDKFPCRGLLVCLAAHA